MHYTVKNILDIENNIKNYLNKLKINNTPKIVAVSKTFKIDKILPLIEQGHIDFGDYQQPARWGNMEAPLLHELDVPSLPTRGRVHRCICRCQLAQGSN